MAEWKKVIVSGSAAELLDLRVDNLASGSVVIGGGAGGNLTTTSINGSGNILATEGATGVSITGSFTGSFAGDGSQLTGVIATDLAFELTGSTGIDYFVFDGSAAVNVAVSGASTLNANTVTKWTGDAFADTNITDDGALVTIDSNTTVSGSLTVTGNVIGTGSLNLQPDVNDVRHLEIYNTSAQDTHITASGGWLFLGDDTTYVKVDNYSTNNLIELRADNGISVTGSLNVTGSNINLITEQWQVSIDNNNSQIVLAQSGSSFELFDLNGNRAVWVDNRQLNNSNGDIIVDWENGLFSGSFSGSFQGDGAGLTNISAAAITGLNLNAIATGSVTASVDVATNSFTIVSGSTTLFNVRNNGGLEHGFNVTASGIFSHAEGNGTIASGSYSHAEGANTIASGNYSHAEGDGTIASGDYSHAEGANTTASGVASHAEGYTTTASGDYSHAEGQSTTASGQSSHAEGGATIAQGSFSHAEGSSTTASGNYSHAEGYGTTASGSYSHAEGLNTIASGSYSHAEGGSTTAFGYSSHAEGNGTIASGSYSHAEGSGTTASGVASHAEGDGTIASGDYSHAEGGSTIASGSYSHAEGVSTTAFGNYSHAEGSGTTASGNYSHAEGQSTTASGQSSHAEGYQTIASGNYSHAEGDGTTASGNYSHAEGQGTTASGNYSHAEGDGTTASGYYSHAEGQGTTASGNYSHAEGIGTIASGSGQLAAGLYNTHNNATSLVIIGNGIDDSNRSDLALFNVGSIIFNAPVTGSVFSGSFVGDGSQLTGVASTLLISGSTGDGSIDLQTQTLTIAGTANQIETSATGQTITIGLPNDVIIDNDLTVQGNFTVNGTTTIVNTTNTAIEDQFILLASGSTSTVDAGIIVQNAANAGEAFYWENNPDAVGRWAIASNIDPTATTVTAAEYMVTAVTTAGAPSAVPTYGGATTGYGNIHVNQTNGDIYIYA